MANADLIFDITEDELPIFRAEADEQLQILEDGLIALEQKKESPELVQALFRAAHTLKGSSGMIGHKRMVELTHALETVLDGLRKNNLKNTEALTDCCLESLDNLRLLIDEVSIGMLSNVDISPQVERLSQFTEAIPGNKPPIKQFPINKVIQTKPEPATICTTQKSQQASPVAVRVVISKDSIASAARALQVVMALQEMGTIIGLEPDLTQIETAAPVSELNALFVPKKGNEEVKKSLINIAELESLIIGEEQIDLSIDTSSSKKISHGNAPRKQLGEILISLGLITQTQLEVGLQKQKEGGPAVTLGQILVGMGFLSQEILDEVLAEQGQQKKVTQPSRSNAEIIEHNLNRNIEKTVRTSVERLDNLMNLVGELITDRNHMYQLRTELESQFRGSSQIDAFSETVTHVGRITDMLQAEVMGIRMLPISNVFNKFPRLVRDLAHKAGKQIDLVIRGEDTELDRSVIEVISDPLIHLIRNAVDHGIESPKERLSAGKPERGIILLTARHEQGRILITVEDNGSGIDIQRVKAKSVEKGVLTKSEADALSEEEAIELIFVSGLSTAQTISDVSGRGVGMDIVRNNIEHLNGNILIETWPGKGSQFTIILPLTLAIVPTLLVRVSKVTYAVPLVTVSETLRIKRTDIQTINGKYVCLLRDHVLPVIKLTEIFQTHISPNGYRETQYDYVVVVRSGKSQMGLIVDDLIGEQEVVVKSLSNVVGEITGISSAAILGDGQVALIIEVQGLFKLVTSYQETNTLQVSSPSVGDF